MFDKFAIALFGLTTLALTACDDITGTQEQAMTPAETGIISPDDN